MPQVQVNGVNVYFERRGAGEPLVLVHGSWTSSSSWALVRPGLEEQFDVLAYDRRGHSRSERPESQGSVDEDGDDLAALVEELGLTPVHAVASSYGGNIVLRLAIRRPELFRSISCHEPPLFGVLGDDPLLAEMVSSTGRTLEQVARRISEGDDEGAARQFVEEIIIGPGAWENELPEAVKSTFVENAPTYLDELQDPAQTAIDTEALRRLRVPVRLTVGSESPAPFHRMAERLGELIEGARIETFDGAGHVPHTTHPEGFVEATVRWVRAATA